ncbi:TP53-target gene 5 protein [Mus caroli]|uniref:TP53-target gene 5 protein n=1 Tax=Mus caroli TaxID=10089 RepID=A0A6P5NUY9_MUSCR|nr:TP53-target gene 5 protein [Mus caroli]XP_021004914.2 TP53-target gene 5 protein [Mus caroli]
MSPSTKKRPRDKVPSKTQDEKLQDKITQHVSKVIERNRLKMVLKNLSLLKLFKSSNSRIQELHKLARRCWNSMLRVPKILQISSRDKDKVKQNNIKFQEIRVLEMRPNSKKAESVKEPKQKTSKKWKPKQGSKGSPAAVTWRKKQEIFKVSKVSKSGGLQTRAQKRKTYVKKPRVVFLKTYHHSTTMGKMKALDITDQLVWFEGLPTRIHIPGRRIMCRSSTYRCLKRSCTRFCCASL